MRILHTSDWHLGISTGPVSRSGEQRQFLDWLLETMAARQMDALVVAGDVFDSMHPSAEALELYFGFLARAARAGVRSVVITGGNHDSPSHLDAPRALLGAIGVHVVGGVPAAADRRAEMVAPLYERGSNEPAAVCLAVPYVHEYRLGVRTTDLDRSATRSAFEQAFARLYAELADEALARFPGLPLVGTGHLTLGREVRRDDYPLEIHQVGSIESLGPELLDPRLRYVARGHIHRCDPVRRPDIWYCGTPIAYSLVEAKSPRVVLAVELGGERPPLVERIEVPAARDLVELRGPPDAVLAALESLDWSTPLPPLIHVCVATTATEPGLTRRLQQAAASRDAREPPILVEVKLVSAATEAEPAAPATPQLEELEPREVFALLCQAEGLGGDDRAALEAAFNALASADDETLEAMLAADELGPTAGASS